MADTVPCLRPSAVTSALETLGRLSLRDLSVEDLLQKVTDLAGEVLPGRPDASVTILVRGTPTTVASTGDLAIQLDERQYEQDAGPCLHAARTAELTEIVDTRTEPRWPGYAPGAADAGCLSSLSLPLVIDREAQVTGALNVYARTPAAFDETSRTAGLAFASYAAVAAANLHALRSARETAENLRVALESRAVIDQAKGILMERYRITADQAFQMLAQASMGANIKLRLVADQLVSTGALPQVRRRT